MAAATLASETAIATAAEGAGLRARVGKTGTPFGLTVCLVAAGLVVAGVGVVGLVRIRHITPAAQAVAQTSPLPAPTGQIAVPPRPTDSRPGARPVRLTIPVIGVNTTLIRLGLMTSGALQVPSDWSVAGWYTGSPQPGASARQ